MHIKSGYCAADKRRNYYIALSSKCYIGFLNIKRVETKSSD